MGDDWLECEASGSRIALEELVANSLGVFEARSATTPLIEAGFQRGEELRAPSESFSLDLFRLDVDLLISYICTKFYLEPISISAYAHT